MTAFQQGVDIELTARQARKLLLDELDSLKLPYSRVSAKTVHFEDLARASCIYVTVHGWEPHRETAYFDAYARRYGFRVQFER